MPLHVFDRDDILNGLVDSAREPFAEAFPFVFVLACGGS